MPAMLQDWLSGSCPPWAQPVDEHLQASLTEDIAEGLTSLLVPACSPATSLSKGGLQMALCGKLVELEGRFLTNHSRGIYFCI